MDDLIKRQDAIRAVTTRDGCGRCEKAIKNIPSAQQWIPCSERLPEDDETVIVTRDNDIIAIATFEEGEVNNGWWMDFWYTEDNVKAWMPLPEPYKGEEK